MAKERWLESTRKPGLRFKVIAHERMEGGAIKATLLGAHGVPFEKTITDEVLEKNGYRLAVVEVPDAGAVPPV